MSRRLRRVALIISAGFAAWFLLWPSSASSSPPPSSMRVAVAPFARAPLNERPVALPIDPPITLPPSDPPAALPSDLPIVVALPDHQSIASSPHASSCDVAAGLAAVRAWVSRARNAYVPEACNDAVSAWVPESAHDRTRGPACDIALWHGRAMYASVWEARIPCALRSSGPPATVSDWAISVVCTGDSLVRAAAAADTWGRRARALGAVPTFYARSLEGADAAHVATLRSVGRLVVLDDGAELDGGGADDAAASWPLRALAAAAAAAASAGTSGARWHVFLTDETWLSLEEAIAMLAWHESELPLLVGHISAGRAAPTYSSLQVGGAENVSLWTAFATRLAGTAGVILSRPALAELGGAVLTRACPWPPRAQPAAQRWDTALARCAWLRGVPQMHSPLMVQSLDSEVGKSWHMDSNPTALESLITVAPYERYSYVRYDGSGDTDDMYTLRDVLRFKNDTPAFVADSG